MNLDGFEARVLGRDLYLAIAKQHGLLTKKWTIGRLKPFKEEIKELVKEKLSKGKLRKKSKRNAGEK